MTFPPSPLPSVDKPAGGGKEGFQKGSELGRPARHDTGPRFPKPFAIGPADGMARQDA